MSTSWSAPASPPPSWTVVPVNVLFEATFVTAPVRYSFSPEPSPAVTLAVKFEVPEIVTLSLDIRAAPLPVTKVVAEIEALLVKEPVPVVNVPIFSTEPMASEFIIVADVVMWPWPSPTPSNLNLWLFTAPVNFSKPFALPLIFILLAALDAPAIRPPVAKKSLAPLPFIIMVNTPSFTVCEIAPVVVRLSVLISRVKVLSSLPSKFNVSVPIDLAVPKVIVVACAAVITTSLPLAKSSSSTAPVKFTA